MKFRPLHDRVVVRRLEGEEKCKDGETLQYRPYLGGNMQCGTYSRFNPDLGKDGNCESLIAKNFYRMVF